MFWQWWQLPRLEFWVLEEAVPVVMVAATVAVVAIAMELEVVVMVVAIAAVAAIHLPAAVPPAL